MAKKISKKQKEEAVVKQSKLSWIIICLLCAVLIFFTLSKTGKLGTVLNNILTYLIGSLYFFPLLGLFTYAVYSIFFSSKYPTSKAVVVGLYVLNIAIIILSALIDGTITTYSRLTSYIVDTFRIIFGETPSSFNGGVLGNFLYVTLFTLLSKKGTIIIIVVMFVVAAILIIPKETYKQIYENIKENIKNNKELKKQEKANRLEQKEKQEEERRLNLAKEFAKQAENDALNEVMVDDEVIEIKDNTDHILSNSKTFINLNEKEIYGTSKKTKNYQVYDNEEIEQTKPTRILKVKRTNVAYHLPKPYDSFLDNVATSSSNVNKTSAKVKGEKVIEILADFGIEASLINTYIGPSVTKFEIKPKSTVKINKIMNISDNIKMELAAKDIRIEAPIPGRSAVGIEIPNVEPDEVRMYSLMKNIPSSYKNNELLFALGKDLMGRPVYCDLTKMPHLLIAGATGSGKSVCINSIIMSLLLRTNPDRVKIVLVDPKKVEFTPYKDIPHLLWPIIDDSQMASNMLKRVVVMMQERYDAFAEVGVRNISGFNEFVEDHNMNLKANESPMQRLPYIVIIIDELADLMMVAGKDVESSIQRITQLARASGIHLIVATQRPSTDVITGLIKSNIPSRISFAVASSIDSRTILDQTGAERLLGNGDMLYHPQAENAPIRLQGVFVTDKEIKNVTKFVKEQAKPEYEDSYFEFLTNMSGSTVMSATSVNADSQDSLYDEVVEFVKLQQKASTSLLQRRFGIGYNRAARLIDTLEDRGIIGPANGSKPREVYVKLDDEQ